MRSVLVKPRWIGIHLLAVLAVAVCLGLGYWQFERAQEPSREVVTNPVERLAAAQPLDKVLEPGEYMPEGEGNQAVTTTGVFDPGGRRLAPALSPQGEKGYYVVVPLVTGEDTAIAVSRGWIPQDAAGSADRLPDPPGGEVTVTGWLAPPDKAEDGYIPMETPPGHVERIAPSLLVNEWPYRLYEGYIISGEQRPADPALGSAGTQLRRIPPPEPPQGVVWNWRNVSYAGQWVVFGGAVLVFWVSLMRRELRGDDDSAVGGPSGGGGGTGGNAGPAGSAGPEPGGAASGGGSAEAGAAAGGGAGGGTPAAAASAPADADGAADPQVSVAPTS